MHSAVALLLQAAVVCGTIPVEAYAAVPLPNVDQNATGGAAAVLVLVLRHCNYCCAVKL